MDSPDRGAPDGPGGDRSALFTISAWRRSLGRPSSTFICREPRSGPRPLTPPPLRPRRERHARAAARRPPLRHRWYPPCKDGARFRRRAAARPSPPCRSIGLSPLVVKLTSRGPAFYTQTRVGKDGRLFTIYKMRTMVHNCESLTGPRWSMPGDPRVTRVGWFLRTTHLDELPQLLNVLRGDMSLIGPRRSGPEFVPELERPCRPTASGCDVRPGVTGPGPGAVAADTDLDSVRRKLAYDLYLHRAASARGWTCGCCSPPRSTPSACRSPRSASCLAAQADEVERADAR